MKKILFAIALFCGVTIVSAQTTFGVRLGLSPSVDPGTNHLIVNRGHPVNEALFNAQKVKAPLQIGAMVRHDLEKFWFSTELTYGQSTTQYSFELTHPYGEFPAGPAQYEVTRGYLELPVIAGVKLGIVEVFSGFYLNGTLHSKDGLAEMQGYSTENKIHPGFLSGIGVNMGKVLFDVRYQQQFSNYGQGLYLNGEELILKNAPGRVVATAGLRF